MKGWALHGELSGATQALTCTSALRFVRLAVTAAKPELLVVALPAESEAVPRVIVKLTVTFALGTPFQRLDLERNGEGRALGNPERRRHRSQVERGRGSHHGRRLRLRRRVRRWRQSDGDRARSGRGGSHPAGRFSGFVAQDRAGRSSAAGRELQAVGLRSMRWSRRSRRDSVGGNGAHADGVGGLRPRQRSTARRLAAEARDPWPERHRSARQSFAKKRRSPDP